MPASEVLHPHHSFQHLRPATCKQLLWSKQDWKYLWGCVGHSSSPSWWTLCQWCHHHCRKKEKKSESDTLMSGYKSLGKCSMQRRLKTNSPERHLTKERTWAHTPTHTRIHILNYRNTHTCTNTRKQTHTNTHKTSACMQVGGTAMTKYIIKHTGREWNLALCCAKFMT